MIGIILNIALVSLLGRVIAEVELRYLDEDVDPCDNFYQYACGKFTADTPPDSVYDLFTITESELIKIGTEILSRDISNTDPRALKQAKTAYKACTEVDAVGGLWYYDFPENEIVNELAAAPLLGTSKPSEKISLSKIGEFATKHGINHLFEFMIKNVDPEDYMFLMFPDSTAMSQLEMTRPKLTKSYDEILEESFKKILEPGTKRRILIEDPFDVFLKNVTFYVYNQSLLDKRTNASRADVAAHLEEIKTFAAQLYDGGIVDDELSQPVDVSTLEQLQQWSDQTFGDDLDINWVDYFKALFKDSGIGIDENFLVYIADTKAVYGILNLLRKTESNIIQNFILLRSLMYLAPDSGPETRVAYEIYYNSSGLPKYTREEYCTRKILDVVDTPSTSFAVVYDFVNYHFNYNKFQKAVEIINHSTDDFKTSLSWVDEESKENIVQKLKNIEVYLGYPEFIDNKNSLDTFYENLEICEWDHYGNAQRIRAFRHVHYMRSLTQSTDPDQEYWEKSPFEVNAYTLRSSNRIVVPLSILHSSFLNGGDPIFDYSRFGSIVTHEFFHHFDSVGVSYTEGGVPGKLLSNWTKEQFKTKYQCLIDQYSNYKVDEIDAYVNGSVTLDENIADNGGVLHAYRAFKKLISNLTNPSDKFTLEQLFFISYATNWCSIESPTYLKKLVESNTHSPSRFRVIGPLSNMKEFSDAFNCPVGSKMNPENKCHLW